MSALNEPKVFISYSWSNEDHVAWVLELAKRLVNDGVDVVIDRWDLKPGQDKYEFMEQMVKDSTVTKVLMVCDRVYTEKADKRTGGVGDETQIISPEIYGSISQSKFIPLIAEKDENGHAYKPVYLKARIHIDLSNPMTYFENYEDLLRDIYGKPLHTKPSQGKPPTFLQDDTKPQPSTTHKLQTFKAALLASKPTMTGLAEDYLLAIDVALDDFDLKRREKLGSQEVGSTHQRTFEEAVRHALSDALPLRQQYIEFVVDVCQYSSDERVVDPIGRFFERALRFYVPAENNMEPLKLVIPELFLYTCALFIKNDRFDYANRLLGRSYMVHDQQDSIGNSARIYGFSVFQPMLRSVEAYSQQQGVTVGLLLGRATDPNVSVADIKSTDYVLFLRSVIRGFDNSRFWRPITQSHLEEEYALPVFQKATSKQFFDKLKIVLGVQSKDDLINSLQRLIDAKQMPRIRAWDDQSGGVHWILMGVSNLDTV